MNVAVAATSGSASILDQTKPGWLGTTATVAGRVTAHNRSNALCPRRAPAAAASTVPVVSVTSSPITTKARHRRRASRRSQATPMGSPSQPVSPPATVPGSPGQGGYPHRPPRRRVAGSGRGQPPPFGITVVEPAAGGGLLPAEAPVEQRLRVRPGRVLVG